MNARSYRVNVILSTFDFPPITGLGETSILYQTEMPQMVNGKVLLTIMPTFILKDMSTNQKHRVLSAQSVYEIPPSQIQSREDVYEFCKDATLALNEAYKGYKEKYFPQLRSLTFPTQPIENYKGEIDRVFELLTSRN